jgi:hypothetical protein
MRDARQRFAALLICLVFASLELLSAAPGLHRHEQGLDASLRPAAASGARTALSPRGEPRQQAPRECPACAISGLFAVVSCGIPVAVPAPRPRLAFAASVRPVPSAVVASLRGRAPPLG